MTEYVAGFLFTEDLSHVLLIKKNKSEWQRGRLNGIGGKIEPRETVHTAMVREFQEETGLNIHHWKKFCELEGDGFRVHFHSAFETDATFMLYKTMEEEEVCHFKIDFINETRQIIPNVRWLIHMEDDRTDLFYVKENYASA